MTPRTMEQNERIKDERKEQILSNALKLFARRGLAATKISDIAKVSGFSQGLVYHYFSSKEEVYIELVKRAVESSSQGLLQMEKIPLEPLEKVKAIIHTVLNSIDEQEESAYYFLLMTQASVSEANPEEAKKLMKSVDVPFEVMIRIVEEGQKKGCICRDRPDELVMTFWSTINGLALNKVLYGEKFTAPKSEIILRIFQ